MTSCEVKSRPISSVLPTFAAWALVQRDRRGLPSYLLLSYLPVYVFLDWVSYVYPVSPLNITPWNPPTGLSLYLLLRAGVQWWPLVMLASVLSDLVLRNGPAPVAELVASAGLIAGVYAVAARWLARHIRSNTDLSTLRNLGFLLGAVFLATLSAAIAFVGFYTLLGQVPAADFASNCLRYWIGDLNGVLVLTPMLLCHAGHSLRIDRLSMPNLGEGLAQLGAIALALWLVFVIEDRYQFEFFALVFMPLIWVAVRRGLDGSTWALAAIQLGLIIAVKLDRYGSTTFMELQFAMIALCMTGLVLGAVVSNRAQVVSALATKDAALNRAMQFAAVGEMSSALVHEVSQPIAALQRYLGACQMIAGNTSGESALLRDTLQKALAQAGRASDVLHRVSAFFSRGAMQVVSVDLVVLVLDAVETARRSLEQKGVLIQAGVEAVPTVHVDRMQIEMVLQNLLNNAIEAVVASPRNPRQIEVRMRRAADFIEITVDDSGVGVPQDLSHRLFEPFVTTKPHGMGLGLTISRSFAEANRGQLLLGRGSLGGGFFILRLPLNSAAR